MVTMVIIAAVALMLTFTLMRSTARGARRERPGGIRWRGIDWSQTEQEQADSEEETEGGKPEKGAKNRAE